MLSIICISSIGSRLNYKRWRPGLCGFGNGNDNAVHRRKDHPLQTDRARQEGNTRHGHGICDEKTATVIVGMGGDRLAVDTQTYFANPRRGTDRQTARTGHLRLTIGSASLAKAESHGQDKQKYQAQLFHASNICTDTIDLYRAKRSNPAGFRRRG